MARSKAASYTGKVGVCESCLDAVYNEADELGVIVPTSEAAELAISLGADIADHICDARDNSEPCACACRTHDRA